MTKEELVNSLTNKIGNPNAEGLLGDYGVSKRTVEDYANAILPTFKEDAVINDELLAPHLGILKSMGGQMRYERAKFVEEWKKNNAPQQETQEQTPPPVDDKYAELLKHINALNARLDNEAKAKQEGEFKNLVVAKMKSGGATDEYVLNNVLKGRKYDTSKSVDDIATALLQEYDKEFTLCRGVGATPRNPQSGGSTSALDEYFKSKFGDIK